jgi:hypothetical protein
MGAKDSRYELLLASLLLMTPSLGILLNYFEIASLSTFLVLTPLAIIAAGILVWRSSASVTARLSVYGLLGGLVATFAYDGVRLALFLLGIISEPFKSIEQWGVLISGVDDEQLSQISGWLFHFWNGTSFGMFFALAFGRPTLLKGVLWGLFLELALLITAPSLLALTIQDEFLTSSIVGHLAYGAVLAITVVGAKRNNWSVLEIANAIRKPW